MLNFRILSRTIGSLLFVETGMFLLCLIMAVVYKEADLTAFALSAAVAFGLGLVLKYVGRRSGKTLGRRDAFFIVATTWIIFSSLGVLPMILSGVCTNLTDAFFESISGFTTTGTTVFSNVDLLPHGILLWRSLTQWIGGLGIVIFTMALLPATGESNIRLFSAEATGPTHERLHPRIATTVKWLFSLYIMLTLLCALCLSLCGLDVFDSINHAMSTTATGGFSTHTDGLLYFRNPAVEYVTALFMLLSGINFPLLYLLMQKRRMSTVLANNELRFYLYSILLLFLAATAALILHSHYAPLEAVRSALFHVISIQTTTGFVTDRFAAWWHPMWFVLFFVMITGGCAGSTSGGVKCIRVLTLMRTATNQFRQMLHPNAFLPIKVNQITMSSAMERGLLAFIFWYVLLLLAGTLVFSFLGLPFFQGINVAVCCLSNVGLCDAVVYAPMSELTLAPEAGKWMCAFLMLAGRLEIFPLLLPLAPAFWKEN